VLSPIDVTIATPHFSVLQAENSLCVILLKVKFLY